MQKSDICIIIISNLSTKMKKTTLLAILISIFQLSTFALSPLNETFEGFPTSVPLAGTGWNVVSTTDPSLKWESIGAQVNVVANPNKTGLNTSNLVLQLSRPASVVATETDAQGLQYKGGFTTTYALPLNATRCFVEVKILKTVAGTVGVRIYQDANNTNIKTIVTKNLPGSPDWQTVQFDFSSIVSTITGTPRLNFEVEKTGTISAQQDAMVVYIDDIKIVDGTVTPPPPTGLGLLNESFENFDVSPVGTIGWAAVTSTVDSQISWATLGAKIYVVNNPNQTGINKSNKALQITREAILAPIATDAIAAGFHYKGAMTTSYTLPLNTTSCIIEAKILKKIAGTVGMRIYPNTNNTNTYTILTANLPGSPDWQTVQFDFSSIASTFTSTPQFKFEMEKTGTIVAQQDELVVLIDDVKIKASPSAINQVQKAENLISYIDPATSSLKFKNLPVGQCHISIKNLSGIECKNININSSDETIDVSALSSGVYIVSCYSASAKMLVGKVIKK